MVESVLVVAEADASASALERGLSEVSVEASVAAVTDIDYLFEVLCYEAVSCLVISSTSDSTDGRPVERAVRSLFPALPIVLLADDDSDQTAETASTTHVPATEVTDRAVTTALAAALDADHDSDASRPPSRLETLLLSAFDEFPVHLYAKDDQARHVLTSNSLVPLSAVIGRTDQVFTNIPEDQRRRAIQEDREVIETRSPVVETEEYIAGEETRHAVTTKVPWYGPDGDVVGLAGITLDINERKQRDRELRRQNERLAKVALVAAHKFRNELQVASGRLEVLPDDTPQVDVIRESHGRLAGIVDDIVDMATRDRFGADPDVIWLSRLAREVWNTYDSPDSRLQVPSDRRVSAQPESLRILLEILLSNAVDHGGPDVTVTLRATDDGFVVEDDGPGIDADPPDRVFDVGFAGSDDTDGFGLYVAQRVAAEHGWALHAEDGDEGARFVFTNVDTVDTPADTATPSDLGRIDSDDPADTGPSNGQ